MNEKTMFLYDSSRKPIGKINFDGENFHISIDKAYPSLLDELKDLLANARANGVATRSSKRISLQNGGELVSESARIVTMVDEVFFSVLKDTISNTRTFSDGRVFAMIPR